MEKPLPVFARPAHWTFFEPVIEALGDGGMGIDPIDFLEQTGRVFTIHAALSQPRRIVRHFGGSAPHTTSFFIFPHVWTDDLKCAWHILSIPVNGPISVLNLGKPPRLQPFSLHLHSFHVTQSHKFNGS